MKKKKRKMRRMERRVAELEARMVVMEDRVAMAGALLSSSQDRRAFAESAA